MVFKHSVDTGKALTKKLLDNMIYIEKMTVPNKYYKAAIISTLIKEGMRVIDVGACVGEYTRLMSKFCGKSGRVFAFEPNKENFTKLTETFENTDNVVLHNCAVSNYNGEAELHIGPKKGYHSLIRFGDEVSTTKTKVVKLDTLISNPIGLIKIDAEGEDLNVLDGAREILRSNKDMIVLMEVHISRFSVSKKDMFDFFNSRGFSVYNTVDNLNCIDAYGGMVEEIVAVRGKYESYFSKS